MSCEKNLLRFIENDGVPRIRLENESALPNLDLLIFLTSVGTLLHI